jgi:hypothetical protein
MFEEEILPSRLSPPIANAQKETATGTSNIKEPIDHRPLQPSLEP